MRKHGFTIVELLIVIVVIAILAAITIVAYNGIQNRAKASAAQAAASQAAKKIALYAVENNDQYPATLEQAGITDTTDLEYSGGGSIYCVTATKQNVSYYQNNSSQPAAGACDGHAGNGVAAIRNLITNPSAETNANNCQVGPGGGTASLSRVTGAGNAVSGSAALRATWSVAATGEVVVQCYSPVVAGRTYAAIVSARPSWVGAQMRLQFSWNGVSAWSASSSSALAQNTWGQRSHTATAPAGATGVSVQASFTAGTRPAVGDTLDADAFMLVESSSIPQYADGSTAGWVWEGTAHASISRGRPL